jgi:hypothetical protein
MGNARIGFKKYKGFRKALSKNEAQTCTECMARGCTGGTHARRRALIERELVNIMTAIKAGILTSTTKAELEKLEAPTAIVSYRMGRGSRRSLTPSRRSYQTRSGAPRRCSTTSST